MSVEHEKLVTMVYGQEKDIDHLATSVETLAGVVGNTNKKLDVLIGVATAQQVTDERMNNLDVNLKESFSRAHKRIEHLEESTEGIKEDLVSGTVLRWAAFIVLSYTVAFGIYTVQSIHHLDNLAAEKIFMQRGINRTDNMRILRNEEQLEKLFDRERAYRKKTKKVTHEQN